MKNLRLTIWALGLVIVSGNALAAFTCEKIKDKATRASCIEDRVEKKKSEAIEADKHKELDGFVRKAKEALTRDFKDPEGARYSDLVVVESDALRSLCGSVNGKNSYGAYVGSKRFYVSWKKSESSEPDIWIEFQSTTERERSSNFPPEHDKAWDKVALESSVLQYHCEPSELNTITKVGK